MGQMYRFELLVEDHDPSKTDAIKQAVWTMWEAFDSWEETYSPTSLRVEGTDQLADVTDTEFVGQLAVAVWEANGKYCKVHVDSTYLENIPVDPYDFGEEEYADFVAKQQALATSTEDGMS